MATTTTSTTLTTAWQSLGTGPLQVQVSGGPAILAVSDTQPAAGAGGYWFGGGVAPYAFNTTSTVWGRAETSGGSSPKVVAQTSPVTAAGGGGGAVTQATTPWVVAQVGSATSGITPTTTQAGTSNLGKSSAGALYSAYAINSTTTAAYLVLINTASVPTAGAAITPVDVAYLGGAVGATAQVNYGSGPPNAYSTGVVALVTTSLTTYTAGGNAFIQVRTR